MSAHPSSSAPLSDRAQARRQQVLDAAAECFRRRGFHGASMAEIAKTAGMSPGHIYNLFENKDDIISAIVDLEREKIIADIGEMQREDDVLRAMIDRVELGIEESTQVADAALGLEVLAEAGRNARLAKVVQDGESVVRESAIALIRQALGPAADTLSEAEIGARATLLGALFNGLMVMSVRQPEMDKAAVAVEMQRVVRVLLEA